jgi:hypothetical protein
VRPSPRSLRSGAVLIAGPERGSTASGGQPSGVALSALAWQPCRPGVTVSCTSETPPAAPQCAPGFAIVTVAGVSRSVPAGCPGASSLVIVEPPAHGVVSCAAATRTLTYTPAPGFVGDDAFSFVGVGLRGVRSVPSRVTVTVFARKSTPAAPKLTVVGRPRLDRRGRVVVRAVCDRACEVKLRVRVKLRAGHNLDGRAVRASAPANGTVVLRLKRAPTKRRIVGARVLGRIVGADGRTRLFSLTL